LASNSLLIISHAKDLNIPITDDQVEAIIQNTAVDLPDDPTDNPDAGPDWDSHGRVDMLRALTAVRGAFQ
jgi:hypothetical protein